MPIQSERNKRIFYAVILLIIAVGLGYLLYIVFFRGTPGTTPGGNENVNNTNGALPNVNEPLGNINGGGNTNDGGGGGLPGVSPVANGGLTETDVLTPNSEAQNPAPSSSGSIRYYNPDDGKFYSVNDNGDIVQIAEAQFPYVDHVTWSDTSNEVILEFPDGSNVYYHLDTKRQVTLPKEFEDFDFSPNSSQIAFKYMAEEEERRALGVANPDGSSIRTLESLGQNGDKVNVDWSPTGNVVATYSEFVNGSDQELTFIGLHGENFKGAVVDGRGLKTEYSPNGQQLLYSVYSASTGYQPSLWLVDANGDDIGKNREELQLHTSPDKCAFNSTSTVVYCGVPSEQKFGSGIEPDVLDGTTDDIYRVDLNTGLKERIAVPVDDQGNPAYTVDDIFVGKDGSTLYFRDKKSGKLVKIDLP